MRPLRQKQIIILHLEGFKNVSQKLDILQDSIKNAVQRGESWLEETDEGQTFLQINQYLSEEHSRCLQTCLDIAGENDEVYTFQSEERLSKESFGEQLTDQSKIEVIEGEIECRSEKSQCSTTYSNESKIKDSVRNIEEKYSALSRRFESLTILTETLSQKIKSIEKRNRDQDKHIREITKNQSTADVLNSSKYEELVHELQRASEYMQSLSERLNKCEESNEIIPKKQKELEIRNTLSIGNVMKQIQDCNNFVVNKTDLLLNQLNENERKVIEISDKLNESKNHMENELTKTTECISSIKSENETFSEKMSTLEKHFNDIPKDVDRLKKDIEDVSTTLFQNKISTTSSLSNLHKGSKYTDAKMPSFSSDIDIMSEEIIQPSSSKVVECLCVQISNIATVDLKKDQIVTLFDRPVNLNSKLTAPPGVQNGIYTAPYDGLYLISLMVENLTDVKFTFFVYRKGEEGEESVHAMCQANQKDLTACTVVPLTLAKGDQVYIKPSQDCTYLKLGNNSFFSCILMETF